MPSLNWPDFTKGHGQLPWLKTSVSCGRSFHLHWCVNFLQEPSGGGYHKGITFKKDTFISFSTFDSIIRKSPMPVSNVYGTYQWPTSWPSLIAFYWVRQTIVCFKYIFVSYHLLDIALYIAFQMVRTTRFLHRLFVSLQFLAPSLVRDVQ